MRESLSRTAVVNAARDLLVTEGLNALSLRRLASKLNVTAAALYAYVDNKRDLLEAVIEKEFEVLIESFEQVKEGAPITCMCRMSRVYVQYAQDNPRVFRTMFMFRAQLAGEASENDFAMATKAFNAARKPLLDAMNEGLIRKQDPLMAHLAIWTAVHGAATVLLLGPALGAVGEDRLANTLIDTVIRGLCTDKGRAQLDAVGLIKDAQG